MADEIGDTRSHWSSRFAFAIAAGGPAVGLGNIWRFPYLPEERGGQGNA